MRTAFSLTVVLLTFAGGAAAQTATTAATPEEVVQRFVDAANALDAGAMAALVAEDAVFARLPGGEVMLDGRDAIRRHYERSLRSRPAEFHITVESRIVEGQFVIDQEHFAGLPGRSQATWMYLVQDGLIRRAWVLDAQPPPAP